MKEIISGCVLLAYNKIGPLCYPMFTVQHLIDVQLEYSWDNDKDGYVSRTEKRLKAVQTRLRHTLTEDQDGQELARVAEGALLDLSETGDTECLITLTLNFWELAAQLAILLWLR